MKNYQKQFKKDVERLKLSSNEKSELFGDFKKMMTDNPLEHRAVPSPLGSLGFRVSDLRRYTYVSLAIILAVGIGTTSAAEFSTPGDALYGIKRNINDKAVEVVAFTPEAKAEAKVTLVKRRLKEMEILIENDEAEAEDIDYLENTIEEHTNDAVEIIQNASKESPEKVTKIKEGSKKVLDELNEAITTHKNISDRLKEESDDEVEEDEGTPEESTEIEPETEVETEEINTLMPINPEMDVQEMVVVEVEEHNSDEDEKINKSIDDISRELDETHDFLETFISEDSQGEDSE